MKIIYPNGSGGISVVHPTGELPVHEVARKDVPAGTPYLLIEDDDLPADRVFRGAWQADFSKPHGEGVGADAWFAEQLAIGGGDVASLD